MPLPTPNEGESQSDFIERCMEDEQAREDFEDTDQRLAVCQRQWEEGKTMSTRETKQVGAVEIKDESEGKVRAVVATLGVKDKDGDVIEPGAFGTQPVKVSAFNHASWQGALPVGRGTVTESGEKAVADLQFFMDTPHGEATFNTVKGLAELGEWSFGFDVTEEGAPEEEQRQNGVVRVLKGLDVHEVSPVLRGAGVDTQTLVAKSDDLELSDLVRGYCEAECVSSEEAKAAAGVLMEYGEEETKDEPEEEEKAEEDDLKEQIAAEVGRAEILRTQIEAKRG